MTKPDPKPRRVNPAKVLREIANAVPEDCRECIIVVGSLAAGYHFRKQLRGLAVRTKDADCLLSPRAEAIKAGVAITEQLLNAGWQYHLTPTHPAPGTDSTPEDRLPAVRLSPPGPSGWFIELLTVPKRGRSNNL